MTTLKDIENALEQYNGARIVMLDKLSALETKLEALQMETGIALVNHITYSNQEDKGGIEIYASERRSEAEGSVSECVFQVEPDGISLFIDGEIDEDMFPQDIMQSLCEIIVAQKDGEYWDIDEALRAEAEAMLPTLRELNHDDNQPT